MLPSTRIKQLVEKILEHDLASGKIAEAKVLWAHIQAIAEVMDEFYRLVNEAPKKDPE